ncbi:Uma2 family endonuclease [Streptomyces sp. NPDC092296]|uniref:Uma2 family endonuclease n=1 Tax=Streptomyces sp. NPDC092296 TaxID=3366012 RepID=UPI0038235654
MNEKIARDIETLRSIMSDIPEMEGVELAMRDGFIMMSPLKPVHNPTTWEIAGMLKAQLGPEWAVSGDVRFKHPTWAHDNAPDVFVWSAGAQQRGRTDEPADLIEFACEVVSPSSVENDYLDKAVAYGSVPVPAYLILDPYTRRATLHSHPANGAYHRCEYFDYGDVVKVDLPAGQITLDTAELPAAPQDEQRSEWPVLQR